MVQIEISKSISYAQLIQLSLANTGVKLLAEWESEYITLAALPSTRKASGEDPDEDVIGDLRTVLQNRTPQDGEGESLPAFTTGLIGHLSYEVAQLLESSLQLPAASEALDSLCFEIYNASVSLNLTSGVSCIYATDSSAANRLLVWLNDQLVEDQVEDRSLLMQQKQTSTFGRKQFVSSVEQVRQRILAGDFFQANLTRMLKVDLGTVQREQLSGFAERFLSQSQAPFGAILNFPNTTVISASPERFFRIEQTENGRSIFAEPIKGTRPRHEDSSMDEANKNDLLNSKKDRAENIMIADLVRNDLSRICTDESIVADPVCELRSFATVHHLVTRVSGVLKDEVSNLDALLAQFPCGSITGAPKWAAMDAIAELEQRGRGIYCGAIGYFDDRGHADFSVAIRTAVASFGESGTMLTYGTGGGITMLSDPEEEFTETEDKAAGFLRALQL